jgi:hypothetical protein
MNAKAPPPSVSQDCIGRGCHGCASARSCTRLFSFCIEKKRRPDRTISRGSPQPFHSHTWSPAPTHLQLSPWPERRLARVFALAAQLDNAVEIDCYPDRQDLSIDLLAIARKEGCRISMGTDSHGPSQLEFMELGVAASAVKNAVDFNQRRRSKEADVNRFRC